MLYFGDKLNELLSVKYVNRTLLKNLSICKKILHLISLKNENHSHHFATEIQI